MEWKKQFLRERLILPTVQMKRASGRNTWEVFATKRRCSSRFQIGKDNVESQCGSHNNMWTRRLMGVLVSKEDRYVR